MEGIAIAKESKAHAEWTKANTQTFSVRLHNEKDADILAHLATKESRQGYIKDLIRKDIATKANGDHLSQAVEG